MLTEAFELVKQLLSQYKSLKLERIRLCVLIALYSKMLLCAPTAVKVTFKKKILAVYI